MTIQSIAEHQKRGRGSINDWQKKIDILTQFQHDKKNMDAHDL